MNQICVLVSAVLTGASIGQSTSTGPMDPPPNGMRHTDPGWHGFYNATVHTAPGEVLEEASMSFRDGRIIFVASTKGMSRSPVPQAATLHDAAGLHIYPGLIEAFAEVDEPVSDLQGELVHWNAMVTPHHMAVMGPGLSDSDREALVKLGFVAANISPKTGVFRGHSGVLSLAKPPANDSLAQPPVYVSSSANVLSFDRARGTPDGSGYPVSHMGAVALIRQSLIDSDWQRAAREAGESIEFNSLDAIMSDVPLLFDVANPQNIFSADGIGDEFEREVIIVGDGRSYQHLEAIAGEGRAIIVPLRFPAEPDVSSVAMIEGLDLKDLMAWEQAPTNAARLIDAGLDVALTSSKAKGRGSFHKNLRKAIEHGLSEDDALAALTTTPARLLGVDDRLGTLGVGKIASFIVADGPLFDEDTKILEVWIDGRRHEINKPEDESIAGRWSFTFGQDPSHDGVLDISFDEKGKVEVLGGGNAEDAPQQKARNAKLDGNRLSYLFDMPDDSGVVVGSVTFADDRMFGAILVPSGETMKFTGERVNGAQEQPATEDESAGEDDAGPEFPASYGYPFGAYAVDEVPQAGAALFVNASIWTSGPEGILHDAWVMVDDGKVQAIGTGVAPRGRPNMRIIDCAGRHITPGLIDAHSHTGIFAGGGNESSQACTSEVRIHDNLDPATVNWYRQLAAGVTTVNTLHGSANPIGGQNAIHKVRWGARHPDDMLMEGAKPGIKFALGENVKQSNRSREYNVRYPQSRMGVETFIRDRFIAAREYLRSKEVSRLEQALPGLWQGTPVVGNIQEIVNQRLPNSMVLFIDTELRGWLFSADVQTGVRLLCDADGIDIAAMLSGVRSDGFVDVHDSDVMELNLMWMDASGRQAFVGYRLDDQRRLYEKPLEVQQWYSASQTFINWLGLGIGGPDNDSLSAEAIRELSDEFHRLYSHESARNSRTPFQFGFVRSSAFYHKPIRVDLELEALAEILAGERLIHSHSYRQDEILMLCRVAGDFGFKIGSFQHVLEGYKVAEAIKEHALGASCFSDWWAYKMEVQDAIPYNGPIMHAAGVVVSYNSDSDELSRRLNTEAAKAVKYGQIEPSEALKFVTLNPAIQLGIDDQVGSLEVGKDADLVIWSGDPLSSFSVCEATWIDGREYFSLDIDATHRERNTTERQRILAKLLKDDKSKKGEDHEEPDEADEDSSDDPDWLMRDRLSLEFLDNLSQADHDVRGDCACTSDSWLHNLIHNR